MKKILSILMTAAMLLCPVGLADASDSFCPNSFVDSYNGNAQEYFDNVLGNVSAEDLDQLARYVALRPTERGDSFIRYENGDGTISFTAKFATAEPSESGVADALIFAIDDDFSEGTIGAVMGLVCVTLWTLDDNIDFNGLIEWASANEPSEEPTSLGDYYVSSTHGDGLWQYAIFRPELFAAAEAGALSAPENTEENVEGGAAESPAEVGDSAPSTETMNSAFGALTAPGQSASNASEDTDDHPRSPFGSLAAPQTSGSDSPTSQAEPGGITGNLTDHLNIKSGEMPQQEKQDAADPDIDASVNGVDWSDLDTLKLYSDRDNDIAWHSDQAVDRFFANVTDAEGNKIAIAADTDRMTVAGSLLNAGEDYYLVIGYQPKGGGLEDAVYTTVPVTCE